jgi:hypothetical protein
VIVNGIRVKDLENLMILRKLNNWNDYCNKLLDILGMVECRNIIDIYRMIQSCTDKLQEIVGEIIWSKKLK